jgi:hypothetical protein
MPGKEGRTMTVESSATVTREFQIPETMTPLIPIIPMMTIASAIPLRPLRTLRPLAPRTTLSTHTAYVN